MHTSRTQNGPAMAGPAGLVPAAMLVLPVSLLGHSKLYSYFGQQFSLMGMWGQVLSKLKQATKYLESLPLACVHSIYTYKMEQKKHAV